MKKLAKVIFIIAIVMLGMTNTQLEARADFCDPVDGNPTSEFCE